MDAREIGAALRHPAAGSQVATAVSCFPYLTLEAALHPITRTGELACVCARVGELGKEGRGVASRKRTDLPTALPPRSSSLPSCSAAHPAHHHAFVHLEGQVGEERPLGHPHCYTSLLCPACLPQCRTAPLPFRPCSIPRCSVHGHSLKWIVWVEDTDTEKMYHSGERAV